MRNFILVLLMLFPIAAGAFSSSNVMVEYDSFENETSYYYPNPENINLEVFDKLYNGPIAGLYYSKQGKNGKHVYSAMKIMKVSEKPMFDGCYNVKLKVDGKTINLRNPTYRQFKAHDYTTTVGELIVVSITEAQVKQILSAKNVQYKVCNTVSTFSDEDRAAWSFITGKASK